MFLNVVRNILYVSKKYKVGALKEGSFTMTQIERSSD